MRPPVTRRARNNLFARMAVVAIAWLTAVAVLGGVYATPTAHAQVPNPVIAVATDPGSIWANDFVANGSVTITIDSVEIGTWPTDEWGNFDGNNYGLTFDIAAGSTVEVSDGITTKTHLVTDLAITSVDEPSNTVNGTADAGDVIDVWVHDTDSSLQVTANGAGEWSADFTGLVDFGPGTNGNSGERDVDDDQTYAFWSIPDPRFKARVDDNGFSGWGWAPNSTVTVTIDGDPARAFDFATDEWGNFDGTIGSDVAIGQYVDATDGLSVKDMTVRNLVVTGIDVDTDTVIGTSTPGDDIHVALHSEFGNYRNVAADGSGNWLADFGTPSQDRPAFDIVPGTGGNAHYWEPDGDETQRTFRVSDPYITAQVIHEEIWATDFPDEPDGQVLYYRLDDPGTPAIDFESDMPLIVSGGWTEAGDRSFGRYDVQAGWVLTIRNRPFEEPLGTGMERVLSISHIEVTGVDGDADTISGFADPLEGDYVCVWSQDIQLCSDEPSFTWNGDGTWVADFGAIGSDVKPGHWNSASQFDEHGDETHYWWNLPPWVVVELAEEDEFGNPLWPDAVRAEEWTGPVVTLTVNGNYVDEWVVTGDGHHVFELPGFDIDPPDVVALSDGTDTKTIVVEPLAIDQINLAGDTPPNSVLGTANPNRDVRVEARASVGGWWAERWVNADAAGAFVADFGNPGNGWREQWTADFGGAEGLGRSVWSEIYDEDNDRVQTYTCQGVPRIEIARSDGRVDAIDFPEGATVTLEIDDPATPDAVDYTDSGIAVRNPENACETIVSFDLGGFEIPDDAPVTVSDGTPEGTVTTVVIPFTIDALDPDADTVSGTAPVGAEVLVEAEYNQWRYVTAVDDGTGVGVWVADFSVQGTEPGEEQIVDLGPGSSGRAIMLDSKGNTTELGWRISAAQFQVDPSTESLWGNEFEPNAELTITVSDTPVPGGPYTADEWGNFGFGWDPTELDIQAGDYIEVFDGVTTKEHMVTELVITGVDPGTDVVSGTAAPGSTVDVWEHQEGNNVTVVACDNTAEFPCDGDPVGTWHADFAAVFDIQPGHDGNSGQCDLENDCTQAGWRATPLPWVTGDAGNDQIWGGGDWSLDTPITIAVDDPDTLAEPDFTTMVWMEPTEWDPTQHEFVVYVGDDIDLQPGVEIVATDPAFTKTLTLTTLAITAVDVNAESVSGLAEDGVDVYIDGGNDEENDWASRVVSPVGGEFTADFGVPGSGDNEQATVDLRLGSRGTAQQYDDDGDYTHAFWDVARPPWISTTWGGTLPAVTQVDLIQGWEWPEGEPIHITVADVADPGKSLFEWDMNVGESTHADPPWWFEYHDDLGGAFELHLDGVFDIAPGHVITVASAEWEKSVEVVHVTIDVVDLDNDVVSGSAPDGTTVDVWAGFEYDPERSAYRITGGEAAWSVDFAGAPAGDEWGNADLDLGWVISTDVWDEDGDTSVIDRYVPLPTFSVDTPFGVWSINDRWQHWPEGTPVEIVVDDDDDLGNGVKFTHVAAIERWGDAPWEIGFNTNVEPDEIYPGDVVYATIGDVTKVLHVEDIGITNVDEEFDVVEGYAPPGERVEVNADAGDGSYGASRSVDADAATGYWQADFLQPGDEDHEQDTFDIGPETGIGAQVFDDDGDSTHDGTYIEEPTIPTFSVRMTEQQVHGYEWAEGEMVTLTIDDPTNGVGADYEAGGWPEPAEWDPEQTFVWFAPFEDAGFEVLPGFEVTMTQGEVTKSHTVTGLAITDVDPASDIVFGTATPFGWVDVHIHDGDANRTVQADAAGVWSADFATPGAEEWEQQTFDIEPGTNGEANESDNDGDATQVEWRLPGTPEFGVSATHDWIEFYEFAGDTITFTFDDDEDPGNGVLYEETIYVEPYSLGWIHLIQGYDVEVGDFVTVTDGITTKTTYVAPLTIAVDQTSWVIGGTSDPDVEIDVFGFHPDFGGFGEEGIFVNEFGDWSFDVTTVLDDLPPEIPDGALFGAGQRDDDADRTIVFWDPAVVEGHVLVDGEPVVGAEVFFQGTIGVQHTCTDASGYYQFDNVSVVKALVSEGVAATGRAVNPDVACSNPGFLDAEGKPLVTEFAFGPFDLQDGYEYIAFDVVRAEAYQRVEVAESDGAGWLPVDGVPVRAYDRNDPEFIATFGHDPDPAAYEGIWGSGIGEISLDFTGIYLQEDPGSVELRYPQLTDVLVLVEYVDGEILGQTSGIGEFGDDGTGVLAGPTLYFPQKTNTAPEITSLEAAIDPIELGAEAVLTGTYSDPDAGDEHTAAIEWGDGSTTEVAGFAGEFAGSHTYAEPGVYAVVVTVTDSGGLSDTEEFRYIVVYDPDGGFVTGGGWIESPEGAYVPDPLLTGRAHFGFVSKYKKGAKAPTGNTEFQFHAGGLNFHSSEYEWLVVAGAKAMFKGTGTINGEGEYGFLISAVDAGKTSSTDVDLFRIKIWDKAADEVVYDNQMGDDEGAQATTEIASGSIVVHAGKKAK